MKKFLLIITSLLLVVSLFGCNKNESTGTVTVGDKQQLAGFEAGNKAVEYSFAYPEEWEIMRNDGTLEFRYDCNKSDLLAEYATITTMAFTLPDSNMGATNYWEAKKSEHEKLFEDYKELDTEETQLDGTPAYKVKYSGKMNGNTYVSEQIICCRYGSVYLVTLVSLEEYHDEINSALFTIRDSFKFAN